MEKQLNVIENAAAQVGSEIDRSNISWTGATWNPWQRCVKVSAGCKFCYMYRDKKRYGQDPTKVVRSAPATFNKPLKWQREVEAGKRSGRDCLVFTCSWSDWFIEQADAWRPEAWEIIRQCAGLTFQILTKRPERIAENLPPFWDEISSRCWMGTSAENQKAFNLRHTQLADVWPIGPSAPLRFLSIEPLLSPIDFGDEPLAVDWTIIGGESGGKDECRACEVSWIRSIVRQCAAANVPCFVKQLGSRPTLDYYHDDYSYRDWGSAGPHTVWAADGTGKGHFKWESGLIDGQPRAGSFFERHMSSAHGTDMAEWPDDLRVQQFPRAFGRI